MKVVKSLSELDNLNPNGAAICFGNFDGVHLGHQKLIKDQINKSIELGLDLVLFTFHPHPRKILNESSEAFLLADREKKLKLLMDLGVKRVVEIPFTRDFSTQTAKEFLHNYVLKFEFVKAIFLGWDFAFGTNKSGDSESVKSICSEFQNGKVKVFEFPAYKFEFGLVSSSLVRTSLNKGDVKQATNLLGRHYSIGGIVVKGEGRGKIIGIPTANLSFQADLIIPASGVYATLCVYRGMKYKSVTNIGRNPTFSSNHPITVETHILDFDETIYGEVIEVHFVDRLRSEVKFSSVNDLVTQIKKDIQTALGCFND